MITTTRKGWFYQIPIMHLFFGSLLGIITLGIFGSQWEYVLSHMDLPSYGVFTTVFVVLGMLWILFGFLLFQTAMKLTGSWYSSLSPKFLLYETFMGDYCTAKNALILAFNGVITIYIWIEFIFLILMSAGAVSSGLFGVLSLVALLVALVVLLLNLGAYLQWTRTELEV